MIPFGNPSASYQAYKSEIDLAIKRVLDSGWYVLDTEVDAFEKEFAAFHGENFHAVGVANGTDAPRFLKWRLSVFWDFLDFISRGLKLHLQKRAENVTNRPTDRATD